MEAKICLVRQLFVDNGQKKRQRAENVHVASIILDQTLCEYFPKVSEIEKNKINRNHLKNEGVLFPPKMCLLCGCVWDQALKTVHKNSEPCKNSSFFQLIF